MNEGNILPDFPAYVPSSVNKLLRGSIFHDIYLLSDKRELENVQVPLPDGSSMEMKIPALSYQLERIKTEGEYEPILIEDMVNTISEDTVFYDVGSYFGFFSQISSYVGVPDNQIFCFEANYSRYKLLSEAHENDDVTTIYGYVNSESFSRDSVVLDQFVTNNLPPTVVKIDVEGAEYDVLNGMKSILERFQPTIYSEMHPYVFDEFNTSSDEIYQLLSQFGYSMQMFNHRESTGWNEVDRDTIADYRPEGSDVYTYMIKATQS